MVCISMEMPEKKLEDGWREIVAHSIAGRIDHTSLKPYTIETEIEKLYDEAETYGFTAVCVPPCFVEMVRLKREKTKIGEEYVKIKKRKIKIVTVVGFPLGYQQISAKVKEAERAVKDGADEIDMVWNIAKYKSRDVAYVQQEINAVNEAIKAIKHSTVLKVIVETCYLDNAEIQEACEIVTAGGADYIKTSTGFAKAGATLENVVLMKKTLEQLESKVKIKAAGGIKTAEFAARLISAGAVRLGCSGSVKIMEEIMQADKKKLEQLLKFMEKEK